MIKTTNFKQFLILSLAFMLNTQTFAQDSNDESCSNLEKEQFPAVSSLIKDSWEKVDLSSCPIEGKPINIKGTMDFLSLPKSLEQLQKGNTLGHLSFLKKGNALNEEEKAILQAVAPLTSFQDEVKENNVKVPNLTNSHEMSKYKTIISKNMYFIPNANSQEITPDLIADYAYQKACQPGVASGKTIVEKIDTPHTFRIQKEIMKVLFKSVKIGVQMKASELEKGEAFEKLASLDHLPADKIILLERTKQNIQNEDGNKVVKNVIVYRDVKGGVLSTLYTVVLNDNIPSLFAAIAQSFGSEDAAKENNETATNTKKYFQKKSQEKDKK